MRKGEEKKARKGERELLTNIAENSYKSITTRHDGNTKQHTNQRNTTQVNVTHTLNSNKQINETQHKSMKFLKPRGFKNPIFNKNQNN